MFTTLGNISGAEVDPSNWGLLQGIGVAGLITLVFIRMPVRLRWLVVLQALFMVGALSWIAWTLDRKHFQFSL